MKVNELIVLLQAMPQDMDVVIREDYNLYADVSEVGIRPYDAYAPDGDKVVVLRG